MQVNYNNLRKLISFVEVGFHQQSVAGQGHIVSAIGKYCTLVKQYDAETSVKVCAVRR